MERRRVMYVFIALVTAVFFCSSMPVMAKSGSKADTAKSSTSSKKAKKKTYSSKSGKSSKKSRTSAKSSKYSSKKKSSQKKTTRKSTKGKARVNINRATAAELTEITGIGPKTAKKIVAYRKKHGKFKKADDLLNVKGIGEKTLKKMKSQLIF